MGMTACYMEADKILIEKLKDFDSEHLMEGIENLEENGQNVGRTALFAYRSFRLNTHRK